MYNFFSTAPEGPPTNFHVIVINSTSVEVQWDAPLRTLQNGEILGYIVFVLPDGGTERQIDFPTNSTDFDVARIIAGLTPSSTYSFSVIAYNAWWSGATNTLSQDSDIRCGYVYSCVCLLS